MSPNPFSASALHPRTTRGPSLGVPDDQPSLSPGGLPQSVSPTLLPLGIQKWEKVEGNRLHDGQEKVLYGLGSGMGPLGALGAGRPEWQVFCPFSLWLAISFLWHLGM